MLIRWVSLLFPPVLDGPFYKCYLKYAGGKNTRVSSAAVAEKRKKRFYFFYDVKKKKKKTD